MLLTTFSYNVYLDLTSQTSVCRNITKELYASHKQNLDIDAFSRKIVTISQESFYHPLDVKDQKSAALGQYNFDHPGV